MRQRFERGLNPGTLFSALAVILGLTVMNSAACGSDPELMALENRTGGTLSVEIIDVPDERPLELGKTRTAERPVDTMYQTDLVEMTGDTSARVRVTGPDGVTLCDHVATKSEPAPRFIILPEGCTVEANASR
ncbi:MAG: hypothetical protein QF554_14220 [Dehalococcoidia bacterium]|jgi:hypothetical protein|nr:hypothetical protein [Dehalococcoidia bacterium]